MCTNHLSKATKAECKKKQKMLSYKLSTIQSGTTYCHNSQLLQIGEAFFLLNHRNLQNKFCDNIAMNTTKFVTVLLNHWYPVCLSSLKDVRDLFVHQFSEISKMNSRKVPPTHKSIYNLKLYDNEDIYANAAFSSDKDEKLLSSQISCLNTYLTFWMLILNTSFKKLVGQK